MTAADAFPRFVPLDIDAADLPAAAPSLEACDAALTLLRVDGRPSGQALVALHAGDGNDFPCELLKHADSSFWEAWLRSYLRLPPPFKDGATLPSVTVAICTRDRSDDLKGCLTALVALPDDGQQIIVVDNAPSNDETRNVVARFPHVQYICEARPGLDVARNRALREASTEVVAFIDDDAIPDPLWLRKLIRNFADPLVLAVTGLTMAFELETEAQIRFQSYGGFSRGFRRIVYDCARLDPLLAWQVGAGVNMAVRRSITEQVGFFDEALDAGTLCRAGGDSDMFRRILAAGYRIVYDPEALNAHRHRRSLPELKHQLFGYQVAGFAILTKAVLFERDFGAFIVALRLLRRLLIALARAALKRTGGTSLDMVAVSLRGALAGPMRYLRGLGD